jgi:SAM-dependent MidA family methyltransferase
MTETGDGKRQAALEAFLRERIAATGGITFAEFMEHCLYHPDYGYYMVPRQRIGKEGDFFTSSSVHALFGRLIARQLRQCLEQLGAPALTLAEQGAGEGHLALDILDALRAQAPDLYRSLRYRIVELSPDNRRRQAELLAAHHGVVEWCALEELAGMEGVFLSNELVDAFPVHLVEKVSGDLREVFVVNAGEGFGEELRPPSTPALAAHFQWLGVAPCEGNRAEVNLAAPRWLRQVAGLLQRGFVLTIDYGFPAAELYAPFRRNGTLLAYHRHQASEDPYGRVGAQDLTAHVDFTSLQQAGAECGLESLYFGEQYRFLMSLGFVEELLALETRETDPRRAQALRMTLKNLILPDGGMGETFKVLVQGKGIGAPALLCARRLRDLPLPVL